ncbi:MAG: 3D-(3,5/4)-trihydroxycyclohexane-1,2-dione acylhydrolase (decyclizing) [Acidimicrobiales bacterium]|nr:3D-(3,5/4)-trihydroxycyclohexane-1,2-dione acylhydrolase (decyclizing) [Acidimicrobiales bacterium]
MQTVRLTTTQAIVRWMIAQSTLLSDGTQASLFPGIFAIFGHGNVTCLGHALEQAGDDLPTWRGQNEQGMALAAVAYNKAQKGRQIMAATSSVGPGATNMVTAAAVASANRLPLLLFSGDSFVSRIPDPVLQQVEQFHAPTITVNDSFKAVTTFWDRITHPAQVVQSLPAAVSRMLDPATRGPAFIGLPQDIQGEAFDYPERFFEPTVHEVPRPRPDVSEIVEAARLINGAQKPLIIAGGGVHYSVAEAQLRDFASKRGIPVVETVAGKSSFLGDDPSYIGPIGVTGCTAANDLAAEADVVIAVGCRLQDFTTGSWTLFANENTVFVNINTTRFDAIKHRSVPVVGDARETIHELQGLTTDYAAPSSWTKLAAEKKAGFGDYLDLIGGAPAEGEPLSYAQVVRAVNDLATENDICLAAAGGFPGEVNNGWWAKGIGTFDCEYGFSCMGYEIAGGWGASMAQQARGHEGDVFVFVGDGSYLMMNSDIYSSVLTGHKMIVLMCDNGGYAVINRLQTGQGGEPFNNLLSDTRRGGPAADDLVRVDFAAHARAMGANAENVSTIAELKAAVERARSADRTTVIVSEVDPYTWTEGGSFWEVGVPEVSVKQSVLDARAGMDKGKSDQRVGW